VSLIGEGKEKPVKKGISPFEKGGRGDFVQTQAHMVSLKFASERFVGLA